MTRAELFESMNAHLLSDHQPSVFFGTLGRELAESPFHMLLRLKDTPQSLVYHPEGNAWNHTMMVVDQAAERKGQSADARVFMWAALLHDIGKPDTTKVRKGKITSYDHDRVGARLTEDFLKELGEESAFIGSVSALVRWHMQILYVVKSLPFADVIQMKREVSTKDVALLGLCDRLGRLNPDKEGEERAVRLFLEKCGS